MTAKTLELVAMVESLPVDIKTLLVEKILDSLGSTDKEHRRIVESRGRKTDRRGRKRES